MFRFSAILVASVVVLTAPAYAQGVFDMGSLTTTLSIDHVTQSEGAKTSNIQGENVSQLTTPRVSPKVLSFAVSQQRRKANVAKFAASMKLNDPLNSANIDAALDGGNIIGQIDQMMRPWGLRADNVADAYTVWWIAAWHAVNRRELNPNPAVMAVVKRQAENALLSTPQMVSATDATKQEMAEALLVQAALIDASIDDAAGNPTKQTALAKAVNQGAMAMDRDLDLTKMTLTPDGFVPRSGGRSDASDAAGDDSQLATNNDAQAEGGANMGDYALYAVAGTGLLAGMFALGKGFSKKG